MADQSGELADQVRALMAELRRNQDPFLTASELAALLHRTESTACRIVEQRGVAPVLRRPNIYRRKEFEKAFGVAEGEKDHEDEWIA